MGRGGGKGQKSAELVLYAPTLLASIVALSTEAHRNIFIRTDRGSDVVSLSSIFK